MEQSADTAGGNGSISVFNDDFCVVSSVGMSFDILHSQYAKVVFHDLRDTYPTDADLRCRYTITSDVPMVHGDRVVLYKVGWTSVHEYLLFEWAPMPEDKSDAGENREMEVVFKANALPKDEKEFYQLCYLSTNGKVYGASTPFQFRHPHEGDLCEVEDEESGITVIRSRTALAEEELWQAQKNCEDLTARVAGLEEKCQGLAQELQQKALTITKVVEACEMANVKVKELTEELEETRARLQVHERDGAAARNEVVMIREEAREGRELLEAEVQAVRQENEMLEQKLKDNDKELQELKNNNEELIIVQSIYKELQAMRETLQTNESIDAEKQLLQATLQGLMHLLEESTRAIGNLYANAKYNQQGCNSREDGSFYLLSKHVQHLHRYLNQTSREFQGLLHDNTKLQKKIVKLEEKLQQIERNVSEPGSLVADRVGIPSSGGPSSSGSLISETSLPTRSSEVSLVANDPTRTSEMQRRAERFVEDAREEPGVTSVEAVTEKAPRQPLTQAPGLGFYGPGEQGRPMRFPRRYGFSSGNPVHLKPLPPLGGDIPSNLPPPLMPQVVTSAVPARPPPTAQREPQVVALMMCPICEERFASADVEQVNRHMDSHLDLACPMCSATFPRDRQEYFERHVNRHFSDDISFPSLRDWDCSFD